MSIVNFQFSIDNVTHDSPFTTHDSGASIMQEKEFFEVR